MDNSYHFGWHLNRQVQEFRQAPNGNSILLADLGSQRMMGMTWASNWNRANIQSFRSQSHYSYHYEGPGNWLPPLDHPDTYIHFHFLNDLKRTHNYSNSASIPHHLVTYLLGYLSQEDCAFPKTALEYIVTNMGGFTEKLASHEIDYLLKLIMKKFPSNFDYEEEYGKLLIMDASQADKMVDLLEILCIIFCQITRTDSTFAFEYLNWTINYVLVLYRHAEVIQKQGHSQSSKQKLERISQSLEAGKRELLTILGERQFEEDNLLEKLSQIIYREIPKHDIVHSQQQGTLQAFMNAFVQVARKKKMDEVSLLYQFQVRFLMKDLQSIAQRIGALPVKVSESEEIREQFQFFSFKVLNVLGINLWTRKQKLELIQLLTSCKFLCCLNRGPEEQKNDYDDVINYAFEISRKNRRGLECPKNRTQANELQLDDDW